MVEIDYSNSKKRKISLDMNKEFLEIIDEIANLTKTTRTTIIEAVISRGIFPYFDFLKNFWEDTLKEEKNERVKEGIKKLLDDLSKIKSNHEWLNPDYYWEMLLSKKSDEETKKRMAKLLKYLNLMPLDKKKFSKLME
jgi:hypothetical protein